jgi:protocatechuate 3,4-dioxygenase beta subunit
VRTVLVFLSLLVGCSRSPSSSPAASGGEVARGEVAAGSAEVQLAPPGEPGEALVVTGVLVRADDRTPVAHHRFRVYQATSRGDYEAADPEDERTARLAADVRTDASGRFAIRTIMPGRYGNPLGDPHLHIDVSDAEPAMHSVYFEGHVGDSTAQWTKTTEQGHIIPVARRADGVIAGHLTLPVRGIAPAR